MTAAAPTEQPAIRKGQTWLFQGQSWRVHDLLTDGVIVLIGPYNRRDLNGVTAEELYLAGRLEKEPFSATGRKAERMAAVIERQQARIKSGRLKMGRPKKYRPPATPQPWRCAVLAIDTAANSGWSIWVDGGLMCSGEVKKDRRAELIALCIRAHCYNRPAVLVMESAAGFVYPGRGAAALIGLGAARQAWQEAWAAAGGMKKRRVSVVPSRWRGDLFGGGLKAILGHGKKAAEFEKDWAAIQVKQYAPANDNAGPLGPDECAAICLGCWGVRAGEVGMALPHKLRVHAA